MPVIRLQATSASLGGTVDTTVFNALTSQTKPFKVMRQASGNGSTRSTGAIWLPAGALMSASNCRVEDGAGVEIAACIQDTGMRHPDGSVRGVRVQMTQTLNANQKRSFILKLGTPQSMAQAFVPISYPTTTLSNWRDIPALDGLVYQDDAADICAGFPGPTLQPRSLDPTTGVVGAYNAKFDAFFDQAYSAWGGLLNSSAGQYDRPFLMWQVYARTGDVSFLQKAIQMFAWLRTSYWAPNGFALPEWLVCPDSQMLGDATLGDRGWRDAGFNGVDGIAEPWMNTWRSTVGYGQLFASNTQDARAAGARGLRQLLNLRRLGDGGRALTFGGASITADELLLQTLTATQNSGQWQVGGATWWNGVVAPNRYSNNFQIPLLLQSMIECADEGVGDSTLRTAITSRVETMLTHYWTNARPVTDRAFIAFFSTEPDQVPVENGTVNEPSPDLEGFYVPLYGHLIKKGINPTLWRTRGDSSLGVIGLPEGAGGPFFSALGGGSASHKQFNEAFHRSQTYLWARA